MAVKVQKPYIRPQMYWDLLCYRAIVWCLDRAFDLPMYWTGALHAGHPGLTPPVDSICDMLSAEASFLNEARNTKRAKASKTVATVDVSDG